MNEHGLKAANLLRTLPTVLQSDPSMAALAASIAEKLAVRPEEIRGLMIYTRIDELPESLLDILAVETAISAIYPDTQVDEWWEYAGKPYHFRILINVTYENVDPEKHRRVLERVEYYKNLRSVLDEVEYYDAGGTAAANAVAAYIGCSMIDGATAERY